MEAPRPSVTKKDLGGGFLKPKMLREFPDPVTGFPLRPGLRAEAWPKGSKYPSMYICICMYIYIYTHTRLPTEVTKLGGWWKSARLHVWIVYSCANAARK